MPIRPGGVMNTRKAARTHHQFSGTSQGTVTVGGAQARTTLLAMASQVTHCSPVRVVRGSASAIWAAWVVSGVGSTCRGVICAGGSSSSRKSASDPSRGWS